MNRWMHRVQVRRPLWSLSWCAGFKSLPTQSIVFDACGPSQKPTQTVVEDDETGSWRRRSKRVWRVWPLLKWEGCLYSIVDRAIIIVVIVTLFILVLVIIIMLSIVVYTYYLYFICVCCNIDFVAILVIVVVPMHNCLYHATLDVAMLIGGRCSCGCCCQVYSRFANANLAAAGAAFFLHVQWKSIVLGYCISLDDS